MKVRLILALLAGLALAAFVLFLRPRDAGPSSAPSGAETTPPAAEDPAPGTPPRPTVPEAETERAEIAASDRVQKGAVSGRIEWEGPPPTGARVGLTLRDPLPLPRRFAAEAMSASLGDASATRRFYLGDDTPGAADAEPTPYESPPDAVGRFSVPVPPEPAAYYVRVEADDHFAASAPRVRTDDRGRADGVVVRMRHGGRIEGRVLSTAGAPVAGASVTLTTPTSPFDFFGGQTTTMIRRKTETDSEGRFAFRGLRPAGGLRLAAVAEGFGGVVRDGVRVESGRASSADLVLRSESRIDGIVLDEARGPLADVRVRAFMPDFGNVLGGREAGRQGETSTGADGRFALDSLAAGLYWLTAEKEEYRESEIVSVRLTEGQTQSGVEVTLPEGNRISGRVVDAEDRAVAEVEVRANFEPTSWMVPSGMGSYLGATGKARTDDEGTFVLRGLGVGPFTVKVADEERGFAEAKAVAPGTEDLELRLEPPGGIAGIVIDSEGNPIPRFRLTILGTVMGFFEAREKERAFDSEDGAFKWTGLRPGVFTLQAGAEEFAPERVRNVLVEGGRTRPGHVLVLPAAATVRGRAVAAGTGAPVESAVVGTGSGGMLDFFRNLASASPEDSTDEEGRFELRGVPPGDFSLTASQPEFAPSSSGPLHAEAGEILEGVVVSLTQGGGVDGFVYDESGEPASGDWVFASTPTGSAFRSAHPGSDGYFRITGLVPGTYQVTSLDFAMESIADPEFLTRMMEGMRVTTAEVEEGRITRVVLGAVEDEGGVRLHGRVLQGGEPVAGAILSATPRGGGVGMNVRGGVSRGDGSYTIRGVPPGPLVVVVQRMTETMGGMTALEVSLEVPEGVSEHRHDLRLPEGTIAGRVRDAATGSPLEGIRVVLLPDEAGRETPLGGGFAERSTDAEGRFRFEGVESGAYAVSAGGPNFFGANPRGYGRTVREGIVLAEGEAAEGVEFSLKPGGSIAGTVRDPGDAPVAGASIFFRDERGATVNRLSEVFTDGAGRFRAEGLAPETYRVLARGAGLGYGSVDGVRVPAGGEIEVRLVLSPGTELLARILDVEGKPIPGASASLFDAGGNRVSGLLGFADFLEFYRKGSGGPGTIRVGTFPPGAYRLRARAEGFDSREIEVSLGGAEERTVEVRLPKS